MKALSKEEFIKMATETHGDKYDYSLTEYKNTRTKVKIICKEHGEFELPPRDHYRDSRGCSICYYNDKTLEFIKRSKEIHGEKYDYSLVKFTTINKNVIIICKEHGPFKQKASHHICGGHGCSACSKNKPLGQVGFIERAKQAHNDRYDYSLVNYTNIDSKVIIVCKIHGQFEQFAGAHTRGFGCVSCSITNISKKEILWLDYLNIPQEFRQKRIYINDTRYNLDALDKENKTIYEFYGDYWHGNPKIYDQTKINKVVKKTFGQLYEKTIQKEKELQKAGYKLITIWENEWNKIAKTLK